MLKMMRSRGVLTISLLVSLVFVVMYMYHKPSSGRFHSGPTKAHTALTTSFDIMEMATKNRFKGVKPAHSLTSRVALVRDYTNPYLMAYPGEVWDNGLMAWQIVRSIGDGVAETMQMKIVDSVTQNCDNYRKLVVDVGSHLGQYSMLSGSNKCRVNIIEPVYENLEWQRLSRILSNFPLQHYKDFVGACSDKKKLIFQGWMGCAGEECEKRNLVDHGDIQYATNTFAIDDVAKEDVLLLKVDVEGHEQHAFNSAKGLFRNYRVNYILHEYTYFMNGVYIQGSKEYVQKLYDLGYTQYLIDNENMKLIEVKKEHFVSWHEATDRVKCHESHKKVTPWCQENFFLVHKDSVMPKALEMHIQPPWKPE
ncbi:fjx1 [Acrasis kona]|uniref:Fjx1 n=1 Tax=Acrasis kona TaxID=1008807 RepID=A0AAW2Z7R1_9EUKA